MNTARFDQKDLSTNPYGRCMDCEVGNLSNEEASAHMREHPHRIRILNPPRQRRIDSEVYFEISGELDDAFERLYDLIENGDATAEEVTRAVRMGPTIDSEWERYLREMGE